MQSDVQCSASSDGLVLHRAFKQLALAELVWPGIEAIISWWCLAWNCAAIISWAHLASGASFSWACLARNSAAIISWACLAWNSAAIVSWA